MSINKNNKLLTDVNKIKAWNMYQQGYKVREIAKEINVKERTVYNHIAKFYADWLLDNKENLNELMKTEIENINNMYNIAYESFELSKNENGNETPGDAKFFQPMQWAIAKRIELFNLIKREEQPAVNNIETVIILPPKKD